MKFSGIICILMAIAAVASPAQSSLEASNSSDSLFQASTINALMIGIFDGTVTFGELGRYGDLGLGTFDALDGEMMEVDGAFYRARSDGNLYLVENSDKTPFAAVTFFEPDLSAHIAGVNMTQAERRIDEMRPSDNLFYAIRIDGTFESVKVRAPHAQSKPYPTLTDALKDQSVFELHNLNGTVVGFWCPEYVNGVNVPGYHLHFVSSDRKSGGHVLDFSAENASIGLDETSGFTMVLPDSSEFSGADLTGGNEAELNAVEGKK